MVRIKHVAVWTRDLERLRDFHVRHFGARLELMCTGELDAASFFAVSALLFTVRRWVHWTVAVTAIAQVTSRLFTRHLR